VNEKDDIHTSTFNQNQHERLRHQESSKLISQDNEVNNKKKISLIDKK
jgi:hypothetical protein